MVNRSAINLADFMKYFQIIISFRKQHVLRGGFLFVPLFIHKYNQTMYSLKFFKINFSLKRFEKKQINL
jgi:hypothetical protein